MVFFCFPPCLDCRDSLRTAVNTSVNLETGWKECNNSFRACKSSRFYGCKLNTDACSESKRQLESCQRDYAARNSSYSSLKTAYDELVEDWENTTNVLDTCLASNSKLENLNEVGGRLLNSTRIELATVKETCEREAEAGRNKLSELQAVMDNVQDDLQCLKDSPNCTYESDKYLCLLRAYLPSLCLKRNQAGQELFSLTNCNSLTDLSLLQMDWVLFARENPYLTTLLIFLIIFAVIGFVFVFLVSVWCTAEYRRRRRRVWTPAGTQQSSQEPQQTSTELTSVSQLFF